MSKQSDAKVQQNYRAQSAKCKNCANYLSDVTVIKAAASWDLDYTVEKNRRCSLGGFAIKAEGHCTFFVWAF